MSSNVVSLREAPNARVPSPRAAAPNRYGLATALLVLAILFARPLFDLMVFSFGSNFYSHIPLVPVISAYLLWQARGTPRRGCEGARFIAVVAAAGCAALLAVSVLSPPPREPIPPEDALAITTTAFVLGIWAITAWFFGSRHGRSLLFPLGFLLFMIPLPHAALLSVDSLLQHGSAAVTQALLQLSGTPFFYRDLTFQLPGISIRVAPECSGIHATVALLIVSLLAGRWFLGSPWRASLLALAVLPLALLRNGFRIYTIAELCVHYGPAMIDSPIHHHGGPIFFALSLPPLLALLWALVRWEHRTKRPAAVLDRTR